MGETVNTWLPIVAAIASVLSALIVWGFASGKFVQRHSDEVEQLRRRTDVIEERVSTNADRIADGNKARQAYIDRVNVDLGRIRHKYELIQQRMAIRDEHHEERHERIEVQLTRIEHQISDLQRQIDQIRRMT